jgi:uncharacterized repeat protein (TIGR02543 family)
VDASGDNTAPYQETITGVSASDNTVTFHYKVATGNQTVIYTDKDTGAEIGRDTLTLSVNVATTITVPTIDNYTTTETALSRTWDGSTALTDITYEYTRNKVNLTLKAYDTLTGNAIEDSSGPVVFTVTGLRVLEGYDFDGDVSSLTAMVDAEYPNGYFETARGYTVFSVGTTNGEVIVWYTPYQRGVIPVEVRIGSTGGEKIQDFSLPAAPGEGITFDTSLAPDLSALGLSFNAGTSILTATEGTTDKIILVYTDSRLSVTVSTNTTGADTLHHTEKIPSGTDITVYPPYIPGYLATGYSVDGGGEVAIGGSFAGYVTGVLSANISIVFYYRTVTDIYESETVTVTVYAKDYDTGSDVVSPITIPGVLKGTSFSYTSPVIPGYQLVDAATGADAPTYTDTVNPVSVTDNSLTFYYREIARDSGIPVEVRVIKDGASYNAANSATFETISTYILPAAPGESLTILSSQTPLIPGMSLSTTDCILTATEGTTDKIILVYNDNRLSVTVQTVIDGEAASLSTAAVHKVVSGENLTVYTPYLPGGYELIEYKVGTNAPVTGDTGSITLSGVTASVTVLFTYQKSSPPAAPSYTVIFNANSGTFSGGGVSTFRTVYYQTNDTVGDLPAPPARTLYSFDGWNTAADGLGTDFTGSTAVSGDITVYAKWVPVYTVTVNGSYAGSTGAGNYRENDTVNINAGSRSGYTFNGWSISGAGSSSVSLDNPDGVVTFFTMPDGNVTLTANWTASPSPTVTTTVTVTTPGSGSTHPPIIPANPVVTVTNTNTVTVPPVTVTTSSPPVTGTVTVTDTVTVTETAPPVAVTTEVPSAGTAPVTTTATVTVTAPGTGNNNGHREHWALINLFLWILGIILAVITVIRALTGRKGEIKFLWLIVTVVMAIIGLVLFFLTEDMSKPMAMIDIWTVAGVLVLVMEVIGISLVFRGVERERGR